MPNGRAFPLTGVVEARLARPTRKLQAVQRIGQFLVQKKLQDIARKEERLEKEKEDLRKGYQATTAVTQRFAPGEERELPPGEYVARRQAGLPVREEPRELPPRAKVERGPAGVTVMAPAEEDLVTIGEDWEIAHLERLGYKDIKKGSKMRTGVYDKLIATQPKIERPLVTPKITADLRDKAEDNARLIFKEDVKNIDPSFTENPVGLKESFLRKQLARVRSYKMLGVDMPTAEKQSVLKRIHTAWQFLRNEARSGRIHKLTKTIKGKMTKVGKKAYTLPGDLTEEMRALEKLISTRTAVSPAVAPIPATPKYEIGQIIDGTNPETSKPAKYKITGLTDPNNPDVEEVK